MDRCENRYAPIERGTGKDLIAEACNRLSRYVVCDLLYYIRLELSSR